MKNFSVSLNADPNNPAFFKEFIFNVDVNHRLNLTFIPNPKSFGFINGIEIVSAPEKLYFQGNDEPLKTDYNQLFDLRNDATLENLYRLNVGGSDVEIQDDTGMFHAWNQDDNYVFAADFGYAPHDANASIKYNSRTPAYTAPETVYTTSRVTANTSISLEWAFPVDSGFYYLLRLHFCEIQQEVTMQNQRVFRIFIDNETVEFQADIIKWTGGNDIPIFMDYVAWVPDYGPRGRKDLRLSLTPYPFTRPTYSNHSNRPPNYSAVLNGLEIFKISDSSRSLAAPNQEPSMGLSTPEAETNSGGKKSKSFPVIYAVNPSVLAAIIVVVAVSFLIFRRRRRVKNSVHISFPTSRSTTKTNSSGLYLPSDLCRHLLLEEIKLATNNFDDTYVIGKGGFGNVYKGYIDTAGSTPGARTAVAIKRLNPSSNQGAREFQTEIEMLSKLRNLHLVSLIGYCDENGEMILVYDYMSHGTLRDHLYDSENPPLKWIDRLKICIGAAKGLHYLHIAIKYPIIHRDVKSTNILLDEKWVAKLSDFGLSRVDPTGGGLSHISTAVKGSFGYVDPEYYRRQQLTEKSDVYSFGVVLVEVLCGRPAIFSIQSRQERVNLADWAKSCCTRGILDKIIDVNLRGRISSACLNKYIETAMICLSDKGIERPVMSDVVRNLELALQLQEAAENDGGGGQYFEFIPSYPLIKNGEAKTTDEEEIFSVGDQDVSRLRSTNLSTISIEQLKFDDIFSEIRNPLGR